MAACAANSGLTVGHHHTPHCGIISRCYLRLGGLCHFACLRHCLIVASTCCLCENPPKHSHFNHVCKTYRHKSTMNLIIVCSAPGASWQNLPHSFLSSFPLPSNGLLSVRSFLVCCPQEHVPILMLREGRLWMLTAGKVTWWGMQVAALTTSMCPAGAWSMWSRM